MFSYVVQQHKYGAVGNIAQFCLLPFPVVTEL